MGSIEGVVQDQGGAVIPGAAVAVRNVGTSQARQVHTDGSGHYIVSSLTPGEYELTFENPGFATLLRKGVTVLVGQTARVDASMQVSATKETVTVTGETPLVETEKTEVSSYVTEKEMQSLPLNGRRWDNLVMLTPAVTPDGDYGLVSYRGISGLYNNNMIDGADNNQAFFSEARGRTRIAYAISQATIKEFQVGTSNYSAEFGRAAGGMVNAVTKSGTNQIRGEGFYYIRDSALNATNPTTKVDPILISKNFTKPPDRRQQFGGSLGGPLIKDKLFWFASYDAQRRNFPAAVMTSSTFFNATGTAAGFDTVKAFYASLVRQQPRNGSQNIGLAKLDWQISQKHSLASTVNIFRWDSLNGIQTAVNHSIDVTANGTDGVKNEYIIERLNSVLTPTTVNEARFQYGRDFEFQVPNAPGPYVTMTSGISVGMANYLPRAAYPNEKKLQWVDNLSMNRGRHNLKIGFDVQNVRESLINLYNGGGSYSFSSINNLALDCPAPSIPFAGCAAAASGVSTGKHYTSFTQAFDTTGQNGALSFTNNDFAIYAQDNLKVRPSFTLQLGVRYEYQTMPQPDHATPFDPRTGYINTDKNNIGPRIGFSWSPFKGNKLIVRAGYGVFYARTQNSTIANLITNNGERWPSYTFSGGSSPSPGAPVFPAVFTAPPSGAASTKPSIVVAAPDFANPIVHQFDFVLEREIVRGLSLSASYLGSRGQRLPWFHDANMFPPIDTVTYKVDCSTAPGNAACVDAPAYIAVPFFRGPSSNRPNTNVASIIMLESVANSWYNGLVLQARGRVGRSFSLQASFTWSKALDDGQTSTTFTPGYGQALNPFNRHLEYGLSTFDQRRRFVLSGFYRLPFGNLSNQAVKKLVNGFQLSTVVTLGDGKPATGNTTGNPTVPGLSYLSGGTTGAGGDYRVPWLARNTFVRPGLTNIDFRISREFRITERNRLELLAEAFNLFNHINASGVYGNAFTLSGTTLTARTDFLSPTGTSNYYYRERMIQMSARFRF